MTEKSLLIPACSYRTYDFPVTEFSKHGAIRSVRLRHLRRKGDFLECAERISLVYELPARVSKLFCTKSDNYAYQNGRLYYLEEGTNKSGFYTVNCMAEYADSDGIPFTVAVASTRCYKLSDTTVKTISSTVGGTCAAFHHERLFVGKGTRLYYSAALDYESLSDRSTQNCGIVDLPPDGYGDILKLVPRKEKLYLFREYGITAFTAFADTLNFQAANLPCGCGKLIADSIADCGDKVFFFTERGLYAFDGADCEKVQDADDALIDLTQPVWGACEGGDYFASVVFGGERTLYSYDKTYGMGRFLDAPNDMAASFHEVYLLNGAEVYKFNGQDVGAGGECALELGVALGEQREKETFLEAVLLEGEGSFTVTLTAASGASFTVKGKAGEFRFPVPVRGVNFTLKISMSDRRFRLRSVSLRVRRDQRL